MKVLSIFIFILALNSIAFAGAGGHGIDDLRPDHGAAWFLQKGRPIKYCVEVGGHFGVDSRVLLPEIDAAFKQWTTYLKKRIPESPVNTQGVYIGDCKDTKGAENLSFYFGVSNDLVTRAMVHYDNPIAMAQKTDYKTETGWGKGFVWAINSQERDPKQKYPNWSNETSRYVMILHELGHVFGCDHIDGTVMQSGLAGYIRTQPTSLNKSIDWEMNVVDCFNCTFRGGFYQKTSPRFYGWHSPDNGKATFKRFVGRDPIGDVNVKYLTSLNGERTAFEDYVESYKAIYEISDNSGAYRFSLTPDASDVGTYEGSALYAFWKTKQYPFWNSSSSPKQPITTNFTLTTKTGEKIALVEKRNLGDLAVQVDAALDGKMTSIFVADGVEE